MKFLDKMYLRARVAMHCFLTDEEGAVDIVAIVVLIGIAVLLALIFQKELETLIKNLFATIGGNAEDAVNGTTGTE